LFDKAKEKAAFQVTGVTWDGDESFGNGVTENHVASGGTSMDKAEAFKRANRLCG